MNLIEAAKPDFEKNTISWTQVDLGIEIPGEISVTDRDKFLEFEINQPSFKETTSLMPCIAKVVSRIYNINTDLIHTRMRYVEKSKGKIQAQAHLLVTGQTCSDKEKLKCALNHLSQNIISSPDMYDNQGLNNLSSSEQEHVHIAATEFLVANGGKPINRQMQILVDESPIASLKGFWSKTSQEEKKEDEQKTFEALYDGRQLRARILHAFIPSPRSRSIKIYYDEEKFDMQLKALNDDKSTMLSLTVTAMEKDKQTTYELVSFDVIDTPAELTLT